MPHLVHDGQSFPLGNEEVVLGRHQADHTFVLEAEGVSRRHARLYRSADGVWTVEDLDSANGTRVNGEEIFSPRRLVPGDVISVGRARVWFMAEDLENTELTPAATPVLGADAPDTMATSSASYVAAHDPLVGVTLGGCLIRTRIGSGAAATVYRGELTSTGRTVAIRVFHRDLSERDSGFCARMVAAIRAAGRFTHPSAVAIFDCGETDGRPWYAMELIDGESLAAKVSRSGPFDAAKAVELVWQAATVLADAHAAGLTHLSLTPTSLLVDATGRVRITELGLGAALTGALDLTESAASPRFAAPERLSGETGTPRCDIYSLGAVFYFLMSGKAPIGDTVPTICDTSAKLPKKIDEILGGSLAKNPTWRYVTINEMVVELDKVRAVFSGRPATRGAGTPPSPRTGIPRPGSFPTPRPGSMPTPRPGSMPTPRPGSFPSPRPVGAQPSGLAARRAQERKGGWLKNVILIAVLGGAGYVAWTFATQHQAEAEQRATAHLDSKKPTNRDSNDWPDLANGEAPSKIPDDPLAETPNSDSLPDAEDLRRKWRELREQVQVSSTANAWAEAERQIKRFTTSLPSNAPEGVHNAVRALSKNCEAKSAEWFAAQKQALPPAPLERWSALTTLRTNAPSAYRDEVATMIRATQGAVQDATAALRGTARQLLEGGRFDPLENLAKTCATYPQTPDVVAVQLLSEQAAHLRDGWTGTWTATREAALNAPTGQPATRALALAAGLILTDANDQAKKVLAGISDPAAEAVRKRLLGLFITDVVFTGIDALKSLDILQGEPRIISGALTGEAGAPCGVACTTALSGGAWEADVTIDTKPTPEGPAQLAISLTGADGKPTVQLRIGSEGCSVLAQTSHGTEQFKPVAPSGPNYVISLVCRDGALSISNQGTALAQTTDVTLPTGSRVTIEVSGMEWKLSGLRLNAAP